MALEFQKLKAALFRGPEGGGDTNDWCSTLTRLNNMLHFLRLYNRHLSDDLEDNCIHNFHLGRYIVGYTVAVI